MVNVTKANFVQASEDLLKHLKTASYVAIDEEMTGISLPGEKRPPKDDTPEQRYQRLKKIPERYSIISVGISLFHKNPNYVSVLQRHQQEQANGDEEMLLLAPEPEYIARPYNFYVFPTSSRQARDVTLSPAAIQFLNDHGMDFAMWTKDGVGYLNTQQTNELIAKIETKLSNEEQQANNAASITNGTAVSTPTTPSENNYHKKVVLTKTQDIQFVGRVTAAVHEWLDNTVHHDRPHVPQEDGQDSQHASSFVLPPCNAFLRRALYETLGEAYPSLILEKGEGIHQKDCIVVHRLSEEEKKIRVNEKKQKDIEELKLTIGFYRVFRAISDAARGVYDAQEDESGHVNYLLPQQQRIARVEINTTNGSNGDDVVEKITAPNDNDNGDIKNAKEGGIPVIVHNGLMDLLFLMTHFHEAVLPDMWEDAKALVHGFFPKIFDTKFLAEEFSPITYNSTTLGDMFSFWEAEDQILKRVQLAPEFKERYSMTKAPVSPDDSTVIARNTAEKASGAHEAGYDAFMTGSLYYYISQSIIAHSATNTAKPNGDEQLSVETFHNIDGPSFGMNQLLCWGSLYNLDLANSQDPFKRGFHPRGIFRVSNCDGAVSTRDIHSALFSEARLKYGIFWVDDVTFLVVAKSLDNSTDTPSYYKMVDAIHDKLKTRFGSHCVTTLEQQGDPSAWKSKMGPIGSLVAGMMSYFGSSSSTKKRKRGD